MPLAFHDDKEQDKLIKFIFRMYDEMYYASISTDMSSESRYIISEAHRREAEAANKILCKISERAAIAADGAKYETSFRLINGQQRLRN
jgi:hypothetical protein